METPSPTNQEMSKWYNYFDPPSPDVPEHVFGLPTEELRTTLPALGSVAIDVARETSRDVYWRHRRTAHMASVVIGQTDNLLRIAPLVEKHLSGEELQPRDVRPYRKPIKQIAGAYRPEIGSADKLLAASIVGLPLRAHLNRKIEHKFIEQLPEAIDRARSSITQANPHVQPYIDWIGGIENPQTQAQYELGYMRNGIHLIASRRAVQERRPGRVTARDAAAGLDAAINNVFSQKEEPDGNTPLIAKAMEHVKSPKPHISQDHLAFAAPDILDGIEKALPREWRYPAFTDSVKRYPHGNRWVLSAPFAHLNSTVERYNRFRYHQLPMIRRAVAALPTSGPVIKDYYERVKEVLGVEPPKQDDLDSNFTS